MKSPARPVPYPPVTNRSASIFCATRISSPATRCQGMLVWQIVGDAVGREVSDHIVHMHWRPRFPAARGMRMWSLADLRDFVHFDFGITISSPSAGPEATGVALPTSEAPLVSDSTLAQVACMRALYDEIDECTAAELLRQTPCFGLVDPHQRGLDDYSCLHTEINRDLERLNRVVTAIRIT